MDFTHTKNVRGKNNEKDRKSTKLLKSFTIVKIPPPQEDVNVTLIFGNGLAIWWVGKTVVRWVSR